MHSTTESRTGAKQRLFLLLHKQLEMLQLDPRLLAVLLVVEVVQMMGQAVNTNFDFLWPSKTTGYLQLLVRYFDVEALLQGGRSVVLLILLSITLLYFLLMAGCIVMHFVVKESSKPTSVQLYSIKLLNVLVVGMKTVLALPFWQIIVAGFSCNNLLNDQPSSVTVTVCIFLAAVDCLLFTILQALFTLLFFEVSPFQEQKCSIASPANCNESIKLLVKMFTGTYLILDQTKFIGKYYIIALTFLAGMWCWKNYRQRGHYNTPQKYFSEVQCALLFWISLCVFVQAFISPSEFLGIYFTILGIPLSVLAWWEFKRMKGAKMMCLTFKTISDPEDARFFLLSMIDSVRRLAQTEQRVKLQGILTYHILTCKRGPSQCTCSEMMDYQKRFRSSKEETMWYIFIKCLTTESLQRFPKYTELHLILAFVEHMKLDNKYKALFHMVSAEATHPSVFDQFTIYHLRKRIEQRMLGEDALVNEQRAVDINKFLEFNNRLLDFRVVLEQTVNSYVQFWVALLDEQPNLVKIKDLGSKITGDVERTKQAFEQLCSLNSNNIECLEMYSSFLANVVNDASSSEKLNENIKLIRKSLGVNKNFLDEDRVKYGENSQTGIIVISGNQHNLGVILHCNTQVKKIIGYFMNDLIGQNISRVMPKVIGDHHDESLKGYLDTSQERLNGNERFAPMINKDGFLVPCTILTKPLPNLEEGIKLAGFFRAVNVETASDSIKPYYVLFREDTEEVQGLSENIFKSFCIRKMKELSTNQLNTLITIKSMFSVTFKEGLSQQENSQTGKLALLNSMKPQNEENTRTLSQTPVFEKEEVIVHMHTRLMYRGVPLRLIYFTEVKTLKLLAERSPSSRRTSRNVSHNQSQIDLENIEVQVDEEAKLLADFKSMIGDKNEPMSIRTLKKIGSISFLLVIGLAAAGLVLFDQRKQQIEEGQRAIMLGGRLVGGVAEINYYSRKLQLEGMAATTNNTAFGWWQQNLSNCLNQLQKDQFDMVKLQINASSRGASLLNTSQKYTINQNGTATKKGDTVDLTLFDYITSTSGLLSASPADLNFKLVGGSTPQPPSKQYINFYNIRYTGMFELMEAEQTNLQKLEDFYGWYINDGQKSFMILLVSALGVIVLTLIVAIPFIISVVRISNRVLSLFGYIQIASIQELIKNCEGYIDNFLKDTTTGKQRTKREIKAMELATERALSAHVEEQDNNLLADHPVESLQRLPTNSKKTRDLEQQRCEALMQSSDSTSMRVTMQYSLFSLVFALYFISDFFVTRAFLVGMQQNYDVGLCLASNINAIKQLKVTTMESIIDNSPFNGKPLLSKTVATLGEQLYQSQRQLNNYTSSSFDSTLGSFFVVRDLYSVTNLCTLLDNFSAESSLFLPNSFSTAECTALAMGILPMGLKPSLVGYVQSSNLIYNSTLTAIVNGSSLALMESMQKYLQSPLLHMSTSFYAGLSDSMQQTRQMISIKFAIFIILLLGLFVAAWLPFLRKLNSKVWMTKGMLNMIPLNLVSSNSKLKGQLITGSILNSVK